MRASDLTIDRGEVLRYLGHRGQRLSPELDAEIDRICQMCLDSAQCMYNYRIFAVENTENGPSIGGVTLLGEDIAKHLDGAVSCAVMAATLGFQVERVMLRLGRRSAVSELIYNSACTALVEALSDRCEAEIVAHARSRGLVTSYRYSPGYGDFPLEQQPQVLGLIDAGATLGITLTDSMLMLPRKSVSALIGLYPESSGVKRGGTSCERCENYEFCQYRKEGFGCGG